MRVLIIEDSGVGQLLRTIVKRDGHEPVLAGTGKDGWRLLMDRDRPPDLLILDRMLPDMDGAEVLTRLREHAPTVGLPVLVLTAAARSSLHLDDGALTRDELPHLSRSAAGHGPEGKGGGRRSHRGGGGFR